jgi:hypothetical protein
MKKLFIILLIIPILYSCTEKQNPTGTDAGQNTPSSLFTQGQMPESLTYQKSTESARTTTSFFTNVSWHIGSDVMLPVVRWYFNSNSTAPAGYHYKLRFWYYRDYYCETCGQDGWVQLGTINTSSLATASYTKVFPSSTAAQWVIGLVEAWMVNNSTGASTYLGYAQETEWTWVQVISD